ncbi:helix-turn-helix domain-containing protein, partial [Dysgonomonas sp. 511]|nr:helix-turn-helix domain-containing protein [Dysgonomonas sp. 511]
EIAYEVGFNDPKYFTRCFTKHFGVPPSNLNKK